MPVDAVLIGRRNNPPEAKRGIRSLAVYNPIHYQELPELFMDFVCSLTGKSPSTTGAGSEGALTKGPFNALLPIYGHEQRPGEFHSHWAWPDSRPPRAISGRMCASITISVCSRRKSGAGLTPRRARSGLAGPTKGCSNWGSRISYEHNGELIFASRLGYRITQRFVARIFGSVFDNPAKVCDDSILRPGVAGLRRIVLPTASSTSPRRTAAWPGTVLRGWLPRTGVSAAQGDSWTSWWRGWSLAARSGDRPELESQEVRQDVHVTEYLAGKRLVSRAVINQAAPRRGLVETASRLCRSLHRPSWPAANFRRGGCHGAPEVS